MFNSYSLKVPVPRLLLGDTEDNTSLKHHVVTQTSYNLPGSGEGRKRWWRRYDKGTMRKIVISVVEKYI